MKVSHPLNQILYGPPGTGKTWNAVNYALAIIEGKSLDELQREDHKEVKRRFDKLKEVGRITMVTFHQNFAYEDFIEGIRPVLKDDKSGQGRGSLRTIRYSTFFSFPVTNLWSVLEMRVW